MQVGKSCARLALWSLCYQLQQATEHFPPFQLCFWLLLLTTENWAVGARDPVVTASSAVTRSVKRYASLLTSRQLPLLFLEWVLVNPPEASPVHSPMRGVPPFINIYIFSLFFLQPSKKAGFLGLGVVSLWHFDMSTFDRMEALKLKGVREEPKH